MHVNIIVVFLEAVHPVEPYTHTSSQDTRRVEENDIITYRVKICRRQRYLAPIAWTAPTRYQRGAE